MDKKFLEKLLSQPTAPFCEQWVARTVIEHLRANGVPHFTDNIGNIVVGVGSEGEYKKRVSLPSPEPVRVFLAHMDHPGFHGVEWKKPGQLLIKWFGGGTPLRHLNGTKVFLADRQNFRGEGTITQPKISKTKQLESAIVKCDPALSEKYPHANDLFGGFDFKKPVWSKGKVMYAKACDDLIGVFTLVSLAIRLTKREIPGDEDFIAVLTRGEEVGFVGAIAHVELGWIKKAKRPVYFVSLETSRTLPGAEIGEGPVVRLGDRATVFYPGAIAVLQSIANQKLPNKFQRRVMDGGTCEATVGVTYGIPSLGISIPLGNYHNQSYQGGPESRGKLGPAPEFVSLVDLQGMMTLCEGLLEPKLPWTDPFAARQTTFKDSLSKYADHLKRFSW